MDITSPSSFNPLHINTTTHDAHEIRPLKEDECQTTPLASSALIVMVLWMISQKHKLKNYKTTHVILLQYNI